MFKAGLTKLVSLEGQCMGGMYFPTNDVFNFL